MYTVISSPADVDPEFLRANPQFILVSNFDDLFEAVMFARKAQWRRFNASLFISGTDDPINVFPAIDERCN